MSDADWSDEKPSAAPTPAVLLPDDYHELQHQYDQLQTELFNERKKSVGLMKIVEGNALVHISANTAEITAQAQERYETLLLAVAAGTRWPNSGYPYNSPAACLYLQPTRTPKRTNFLKLEQSQAAPEPVVVPVYEYSKQDFYNAMRVVGDIQADALKKAAEKLRFAPVEKGNRWAIKYENLMCLAEDILMQQMPI